MKTKDILTVSSVALGTTAMTIAIFWSGPIDAGSDSEGPSTKIAQPKLVANQLELTLASTDPAELKAGAKPELLLTAVNPTDSRRMSKVCVIMTATTPPSPMARTMSMPTTLWQQEYVLDLKAKAKQTVPVKITGLIPPRTLIAIRLRDANPNARTVVNAPQLTSQAQVAAFNQSDVVALNFSTIPKDSPASPRLGVN